MCISSDSDDAVPPWLRSIGIVLWKNREAVLPAAGIVAALAVCIGTVIYFHMPSDVQRAEADLAQAKAVIDRLSAETDAMLSEAEYHAKRAKHFQACLDERPHTKDAAWATWNRVKVETHTELYDAKLDRRNKLLLLLASYHRLLADAEREILTAKDARDHGTPYKVAPRVRDVLSAILNPS